MLSDSDMPGVGQRVVVSLVAERTRCRCISSLVGNYGRGEGVAGSIANLFIPIIPLREATYSYIENIDLDDTSTTVALDTVGSLSQQSRTWISRGTRNSCLGMGSLRNTY